MFEAIHGSAPRRANQNPANPSGLLLGAVLMLVHINQPEAAERVHNAWLRTIEDGVHTYDIFTEGVSTQKVGTKEFSAAVVARMGQKPNRLKPVAYAKRPEATRAPAKAAGPAVVTELTGIDVFVYWPSRNPNDLAAAVGKMAGDGLSLLLYVLSGTAGLGWLIAFIASARFIIVHPGLFLFECAANIIVSICIFELFTFIIGRRHE